MFSSITWEIFLTTVVVLIGGYYGITILLLYHQEIILWVKTWEQQPVVSPQSTKVTASSHSVMGSIQQESLQAVRSTVSPAEEINVASDDEVPDTVTSPEVLSLTSDHLLISSVSDLLQEVKTLSQLMAECKSDKAEGESLFRTLLLRYPHLRTTTFRDPINLFIIDAARNQFAFDLSLSEINSWWEDELPLKK